jgi:hypothetical protein
LDIKTIENLSEIPSINKYILSCKILDTINVPNEKVAKYYLQKYKMIYNINSHYSKLSNELYAICNNIKVIVLDVSNFNECILEYMKNKISNNIQ